MRLTEEQLEAAGELLRRRVEGCGGTVEGCAAELCAGELRGWVSVEELMGAYRPEVAPGRWVEGEHEREIDFYDPEVLANVGDDRVAGVVVDEERGMEERAEALRVVMYLKQGLLKARWRWVACKMVGLRPGVEWEERRGPGAMVRGDGVECRWLWGAIIVRRNGVVVEVLEECRKRQVCGPCRAAGKYGGVMVERRELDGERIDVRDISARLAVVLHTCLGGQRSPFRNNEHLAQLLGVTREAMRVRKKRFIAEAGLRSAAGMAPNRARGGRATQAKRKISGARGVPITKRKTITKTKSCKK